ncbi:Purine nucleoside phosphorylase DeoD-type [Serratia symbiotica]|nr:Purine nucleoside phosphorylase DeoD-type [Serratia symbiotica]
MVTPHINAKMGDFADVVLMSGDPLRAKHIADTFLEESVEVNDVRGMLGFSGSYKGRFISVIGHGIGIPSCSIYTRELIAKFGVKKIIRVGSCGAVRDDIKLLDVVIGMGACTDSKVNRVRFKDHDYAAIADFDMIRHAVNAACAQGITVHVGNIFSADLFYTPDIDMFQIMKKYGILGVEMEAAGMYGVAAELHEEFGCQALTICTVSDHILRHEATSASERQTTFNEMILIALESILLGDQACSSNADTMTVHASQSINR